MGLSKAIGVWMGEQRVAGGSVQRGDLLFMQGHLEAMAMGQADAGSPSPCPIAWLRQSPEPRSPSGCRKAGPRAQIPVPCWDGGACCSLGCMAGFSACFAFSHRVPAGSNPAPSSGEDAMLRLSCKLFLGFHPALPPCTAPRGGEGPQRAGIWPRG